MAMIDDASGLDLSHLVALEALLTERHVTRAARRLGVAQSSLSHTLARLRASLGDPLLVRSGGSLVLTPRAEALAGPLASALAELRGLLRHAGPFEPARCTRTFSLVCPDLLGTALPALLSLLEREAPSASLSVVAPSGDLGPALGHGGHDLALGAALEGGAGLVQRPLGVVHWCVLARRKHPALRDGKLTKAGFLRYPHVVVRTGNTSKNRVADLIAAAGLERTVRVTVPGFLVAPLLVAGTDHFFTAPRELAEPLAHKLGLVVLTPPIPMPALPVAAFWHERLAADPAHMWFRGRVIEVFGSTLARVKR